jgi:hypothetical protein
VRLTCWPRSWHGRNHHNFNERPRPPNRDQPIISQAVVHGNVAYFAGITPTRLSAISKPGLLKCQHKVERGQDVPSILVMGQIATALDTSTGRLVGEEAAPRAIVQTRYSAVEAKRSLPSCKATSWAIS